MKQPPPYNDGNKFDNTHVLITPQALPIPASTAPSAPPVSYNSQCLNPATLESSHHPQCMPLPSHLPGYLEVPNIPPPPYNAVESTPMTIGQLRDIQIVMATQYGPYPMSMACYYCHHHIVTRLQNRCGVLAWLICGAMALVGCWPCCILPLCITKCQDVLHFCPNCNNFLGSYKRF
ncbi:unnamed protein product [Bursaphelenchus xylophilus]|uniref:(pine wood nematode) hypothetical protein n=1 Tax=Bursaphelenchus xylophilus TaxID=6326 RepID=A0A1I7RZ12_BURXY|nr:unnamed protein product [Bursaphelenchus xylophilus]CAG9106963.1 unnamed protein product [Bursaphelenchus xylophilus]